jgi:predicted Fe-Mo cluster-binding NifX family protein
MILAITSSGDTLESSVDPRFGRCPYYILYDTDKDTFEAINNSGQGAFGGAGVQAAQAVSDMNADILITTNIGPNAFRVLDSAGIKVYSGISGTVKDAIDNFKKGTLESISSPNVGHKYGIGSDSGKRGKR